MTEYIDREAYVDLFKGEHNLYSWEEIEEFMDSIPAEDVQPVKHGRWIFNKPPDDWIMSLYTCDQCGHLEDGKPNYCPNCGAKMDGEL